MGHCLAFRSEQVLTLGLLRGLGLQSRARNVWATETFLSLLWLLSPAPALSSHDRTKFGPQGLVVKGAGYHMVDAVVRPGHGGLRNTPGKGVVCVCTHAVCMYAPSLHGVEKWRRECRDCFLWGVHPPGNLNKQARSGLRSLTAVGPNPALTWEGDRR